MVGFDDKIFARELSKIELLELLRIGDHGIGLSKGDISGSEKLFGLELIVCETDGFPRVPFFDIVEIPSIISEDSEVEHRFIVYGRGDKGSIGKV